MIQLQRRLLAELRPVRGAMTASVVSRIVYLSLDIALLGFGAWAVAAYATGQGPPWELLVGVLAAGAATKAVARFVEQYTGHHVAFGLLATMRSDFFAAVAPLAPAALGDTRSGDLADRVMSDIDRIEVFYAHTLAPAVAGVVVPTGAVVAVAVLGDPVVAGVLAAAMFLVGVLIPLIAQARAREATARAAAASGDVAARFTDDLQGIADLATYGAADRRHRLTEAGERLAEAEAAAAATESIRRAISELASVTALVVVGALAIDRIADLPTAATTLAIALVGFLPIREIQQAIPPYRRAMEAARRVFAITDRTPLVQDPPDPAPGPVGPATLEFEQVTFAYGEGEPAVADVTFSVDPGQKVAIVGPSGSGKSTLAYLAARLWDPDTGTVRLDGTESTSLPLDAVRATVAVVTQDSHLFTGTVAENLRLGSPQASDSDLAAAARRAAIETTIASLDRGYETQVGELGSRLSGGQRQRLALARALLADTPVLVLDEATSELDAETETELLGRLGQHLTDRAVLVIAHRLSTVIDADEILVMDRGRIVERGRHADLFSGDTLYRRLWERQAQEV